jgi:hypothetical protein
LTYNSNSQTIYEQYKYLDSKYGLDQRLFQGELYLIGKRIDFGTPFLISKKPKYFKVVYAKEQYDSLLGNYDVNTQQIILTYNTSRKLKYKIILNTKVIDQFDLDNRHFIKDTFNLPKIEFLELVGEIFSIKCYLSYYKNYGFDNKPNSKGFGYSKLTTNRYLLTANKLVPFRTKKDFLKLIPSDIRPVVLKYIKNSKFRFKHWNYVQYKNLFEYLNEI